jgi:quinol monooxygenase YgiN
MTRPSVTVVARITARPGMEAGVLAELKRLLVPTRAEAGCLNYDLHEPMDGGPTFLFHENWAGEKHLAAHLESRHVKECFDRCAGMLAGPPEITRWRQVG